MEHAGQDHRDHRSAPRAVTDDQFGTARAALIAAYSRRGRPSAGRTIAAVLHRLQLTLFHAGRLTTLRGPPTAKPPVSVTGWATVAPGFADTARRYVEQVTVSLRPSTVKHIEHDLRQFGTWLADTHPEVASCADLHRDAHRSVQDMAVDPPHAEHRQTAQPGQHQERADQPALLPHQHHRVGLPERADPAADVSRRPADHRQTAAPVPRRRRSDQAPARRSSRPGSVVPVDRRTAGPHRHPPQRTARPDRRRGRADRIRLLAADPDRQAPQRPLHSAAPTAERPARRLDHPPPAQRTTHRSSSARTQSADQPPPHHQSAAPHRRRRRNRPRHRSPTSTHPGNPGHEPRHEPGRDRSAARALCG